MAITKQKKEEILAKVSDAIGKATTLVFANFKGLSVAEQNEMRKGLRAQDVGYMVAKKTLIKRALLASKFKGELSELPGEIALVYGADELAPARELSIFVKKFSLAGQAEHLSFAGGVFGGAYVDKAKIGEIAAIPPMETLRAEFLQLINSPLQRFAIVLNAKAEKTNG